MINAFLVPALYLSGLATLLAVIILVAERYLMDYGEVELTINDEKRLKVKGGNSVLNTLKEQKIFIPSACGGRATCGYCKLKAVSGFSELLPTEAPLLTKEEVSNGMRLSCQIKIKKDVAIQIPEELFHIKEYLANVDKIVDLTYDIKQFCFRLVEPDTISYKAGQYVQFQAPEYGDVTESVYRAYSMCGIPSENDCVDLMVRRVPAGIATTYLHDYVKVGDKVKLTGPFGEFFLRDTDRKMVCIAGGSGMAPLRSILLSMGKDLIAAKEPIFFFGARSKMDLFMVDEWRQFEKENPNFRFVPVLSQPEPGDNWDGATGRVTDIIGEHFQDLSEAEGYLCGSPGMLNACVEVLTNLGLPEERIYYDKF